MTAVEEIVEGVWRVRDTCNVYLVRASADSAIAIDFGSGLVLDAANNLGLRVTDVLLTHHHRDQAQGLPMAVDRGIRIHVPPVEVDLFARVEEMWQSRTIENDYNVRQDRFSILSSVPVDSTVPEYRTAPFGGVSITTVPTPGHTMGSVTYLLERDGRRLAFSGDLIFAPGKVWSMAATQWSYSDHEGPAMTVLSCYLLQRRAPDILLPSHGEPMRQAESALAELAATMQEYVDSRRSYPWDLRDRLDVPWIALTDHLLLNRSSLSICYAILSENGEALLVDYGYDMTTGLPNTSERAARRPWLASLPALKEQFGVTAITVAIPTHYHDDHVGGLPLLRDVEGTEIWVPSTVEPVLANPLLYDLPCQWYDPIPADRVLPIGEAFTWNEYEFIAHEQPGHTLFAVAYEVVVDHIRVLFTGDQQEGLGVPGERREFLNYQYRNRVRLGDFVKSADLYKQVAPGLLASGHWEPRWVERGYLDFLAEEGRFVDDIHRRLLPLEQFDLPIDGAVARMVPYRSRVTVDTRFSLDVTVTNPFDEPAEARVQLVIPDGWRIDNGELVATLDGRGESTLCFELTAPHDAIRRARVAADVTVGETRFGQHVDALVDVVDRAVDGVDGALHR